MWQGDVSQGLGTSDADGHSFFAEHQAGLVIAGDAELVAQAQQQHGGFQGHIAHKGSAGTGHAVSILVLAVQGLFEQGVCQSHHQWVGTLDEGGALGGGLLKVNAQSATQTIGGQALFQGLGQGV